MQEMTDFIETSFLKVPIDQLKRSNKITLKWIEKEIKLPSKYDKERLSKLKSKLNDTIKDEMQNADIVNERINHLNEVDNENPSAMHVRLNRWLVDYFVYLKCYESANALMNNSGIERLCDVHLFKELQSITQCISDKQCHSLLKWCQDHKSLLKKMNSSLEFQCRTLEYVQLIKTDQLAPAIAYAQAHFPPFSQEYQEDIYVLLGLLTTQLDTTCKAYAALLHDNRWDNLTTRFQSDFATIHGLTQYPILMMSLQAGLAAMKTRSCQPNKHPHCPCCRPNLYEFASQLPHSHVTNTSLRCPITSDPIDENNSPMVLPSGYVLSSIVILTYVGLSSVHSTVWSYHLSMTQQSYQLSQVRRAYIT